MKKDVIYVDVDDEITSITDKIISAKATLVALVLPKRCPVLQSSVNMKILQRTTGDAGKNVVLITSEASLLPLAGAAGLYVAKTLQSKPVVPKAPAVEEAIATIDEAEDAPAIDPTKSIGELAGVAAVSSVISEDEKPIELGDDPADKEESGKPKKAKKDKKNKKLLVPNFDKFRTRLFLIIGGVILLIAAWYLMFVVMPRASVTVVTENRSVPVNLTVTADPASSTVDINGKTIPAETKTTEQTATQKFTATGEKNVGEKASGTMTIYNCTDNTLALAAGTAFSSSGYSFITTEAATVNGSNFTSSGKCKEDGFLAGVNVVASSGGDQYNLSAGRMYSSSLGGQVYGKGSAMSGGTTKIVKVVSQGDCDTAKNTVLSTKTDDYKNQLAAQLRSAGLTPVKETFTATPGAASCSPAVGQEASESTATVVIKMSMMGVNTAGLDQLIKDEAAKQIEGSQSVIETGSNNAIFAVKETKSGGVVVLDVQADTQTGIKQDATIISNSIAGKKRGQSVTILKDLPGVTDAKVTFKPFWVTKAPKNIKHITVKFENNAKP